MNLTASDDEKQGCATREGGLPYIVIIISMASRTFFTRALSVALRPSPPSRRLATLAVVGAGCGVAYAAAPEQPPPLTKEEIAGATAAIDALLDDNDDLGPTVVRLAWHASGTYDKETGTGGSEGATMRFKPEAGHAANAGLGVARDALEGVKKLFPNMTYV